MSRMDEKLEIIQKQLAKRAACDIPAMFANSALMEAVRARAAIDAWLRDYFGKLGLTGFHEIRCDLNDFTKHGSGLQSVNVRVLGKDGKEVVIPGDAKAPTIGVVAEGMLEGETEMAVVNFAPDQETVEEIMVLSSSTTEGRLDPQARLRVEVVSPSLKKVTLPGTPAQGALLTASDRKNESFAVILETKKGQMNVPDTMLAAMKGFRGMVRGVYACRYRREDASTAPQR